MRILLPLIALFFLTLPTATSANCSGEFCNNVLVTVVYINGPNTFLRTSGDADALDCDPGTGDYIRMRRSDVEYEDWYALVLTAFVQEQPITIRTESGTGTCYVAYIFQSK
ncbi:MAG: hypothetical protein ACTS1Z_01425 [Parasphingopyxis sp.]|uniref:hypothetical protein n=1 Tax=Parasphingopyxis sp. TaxID=1920299 RepID=UPI003F9FE69C